MHTGLCESLLRLAHDLGLLFRRDLCNLGVDDMHAGVAVLLDLIYQLVEWDFTPAVDCAAADLQSAPGHIRPYFH